VLFVSPFIATNATFSALYLALRIRLADVVSSLFYKDRLLSIEVRRSGFSFENYQILMNIMLTETNDIISNIQATGP
jgi:hypothetical protein